MNNKEKKVKEVLNTRYKNSKNCKLNSDTQKLLDQAVDTLKLSNRGYIRIIKLARTIADMEGYPQIKEHHVMEALQYKKLS